MARKSKLRLTVLSQISRCLCFTLLISIGAQALPQINDNRHERTQTEEQTIQELSLKELADDPAKYLGNTYRISGNLQNKGKNFFSDFRLVLEDEQCHFIYVRPWLPLEFPSPPPGIPESKKQSLSLYLGKRVELTAKVERGSLKIVGDVYFLNVSSAKIVDQKAGSKSLMWPREEIKRPGRLFTAP